MSRDAATPLMQQYGEIKARHPRAILFFRMGDFYEMFYEDAEIAARTLGLTLTSRNNGGASEVPLAGVPVRAVHEYVRRLVQQGFRVAICEQVEDPKLAKGIVRREVVETISPGAVFADDLLDATRNNFLCALQAAGDVVGIAAVDLSTGEFRLVQARTLDVGATLARMSPREVLVPKGDVDSQRLGRGCEALLTERERWEFDPVDATRMLREHFAIRSLDGLGIEATDTASLGAAGVLLRYLHELQPNGVPHLSHPVLERPGGVMPIDEMTRRNLELVESMRAGDLSGTLLGVLDRTQTPMGARALRRWLLAPLTELGEIEKRLNAVEALVSRNADRVELRSALSGVKDIERLAGKSAMGRASPREVRALGDSLARLPEVESALKRIAPAGTLSAVLEAWDSCIPLAGEIRRTIVATPPASVGDDGATTIAANVDAELDELRSIAGSGKEAIALLQATERERTGIASLKVGYNRVFGYFIEVSNANARLVPSDYQRRQTLAGAERYVTPELVQFEERVLHATEQIEIVERRVFEAVRARAASEIRRLQGVATRLAHLDVLSTLAEVATRENYVRPDMGAHVELEIVGGRHPVVERMMPREQFIPNDVHLSEHQRMIILTGPNMAGKSTILRQIGLIVLMAQIGSFVPAARARIGVVDRIFTRVGASDNLVRGQSTFMVEMAETSAILHTATSQSLVLLDEIGRGTSTWDGVSIAWAVSEHLHERVRCKTVFATHYHELTQLADEYQSVANLNVEVREVGEQILFLHRLKPGGADRSYGIEVGRLAGLPRSVIARARKLLKLLEGEQIAAALSGRARAPRPASQVQMSLPMTPESHPVVERLRAIDANTLTPLDALALLARLAAEARGEPDGVARPEVGD